jgi:hypothetical protein
LRRQNAPPFSSYPHNPTCLRKRIEAGQIVEIWEFVWDLYAVDAVWS